MIDDDRLGAKLRETLTGVPAARPDLDRVGRRARFLRIKRVAAASVAAALLAAGIAVPVAILFPVRGSGHGEPAATTTSSLGVEGISVQLPGSWDGRAYRNPDADETIVQFANRSLEQALGAPDDDLLSRTRAELGPDQAAVVLREVTNECPCPGYHQMPLPISVEPQSCPCTPAGVDDSHSFARLEFVNGWRWFDLWVDIGSKPAPAGLVAQVNSVLSSLSITPAELPGAYEGWRTHFDLADRVAMDVPDTWGFHTDPVPSLDEPRVLFAAGTESPIPQGGECAPDNALKQLPSDGALIWLLEYSNPQNPSDFPDRPSTLSLGDLQGPFECIGVRTYLLRFSNDGRYFQFHVVTGPNATEDLQHDVGQALNTFTPVPDASCLTSAQDRQPGAYDTSFSAASGPPGATVVVTGMLPFPPRGEGGQYAPTDRLEVWWNDDTLPNSSYYDAVAPNGPPQRLASLDVSSTCAYRIEFTVPDIPPGTYPVTLRAYGGGGYSWPGWESFTVTG